MTSFECVQPDYEDTAGITASSILVSYTCDVRPSERAQQEVRQWVENGGRWVALHGTNAALTLGGPNGVEAPRVFPLWAETLGSQFVAHPPIQPYPVQISDPSHWLVSGIETFNTDDELYLCDYADRSALQPLLHTTWQGEATGFAEHDWNECDPTHLIMYLRNVGQGSILYNTLGHCRGHYDMSPFLITTRALKDAHGANLRITNCCVAHCGGRAALITKKVLGTYGNFNDETI